MKQKLDDLPETSNEFWKYADVHTNIQPKVHFFDQNHYFLRVPNHQAQCSHCDWGFQLDPGDKIIEGHLFNKEGKKVL